MGERAVLCLSLPAVAGAGAFAFTGSEALMLVAALAVGIAAMLSVRPDEKVSAIAGAVVCASAWHAAANVVLHEAYGVPSGAVSAAVFWSWPLWAALLYAARRGVSTSALLAFALTAAFWVWQLPGVFFSALFATGARM